MKRKIISTLFALVLVCSLSLVTATPASAADGEGTATILPVTNVVAGSTGTWTVTYVVPSSNMTIGGGANVTIPDGWTVPQTDNASVAGYVTVSCNTTGNGTVSASVSDSTITVTLATDNLTDGDTIDVVYGDTSEGGPGATAQTNAQDNVEFTVASDTDGNGSFANITTSPDLDVVPDSEDHFLVVTEHSGTEVAGTAFSVNITAKDQYENTVTAYTGNHTMTFTSTATAAPDGTDPTIPEPESIAFTAGEGTSAAGFTLVKVSETPTISVSDNSTEPILGESDPIIVEGINLDSRYYGASGDVQVWVCDDNQNADPMALETVTVSANSTTDTVGDTEITLTEMASDTGIFEGLFTLIPEPPASRVNDEIVVSEGDTITVTYDIPDDGEWAATADVDTTSPEFTSVVADTDYYKNGATITLTADIGEDGLTVTADFSSIDSEYTTGGENVVPTGGGSGEYVITYTIAEANTMADDAYPITVTAEDDAGNSATDTSCSITLDNTAPAVSDPTADPVVIQPGTPTDVTFTATVTDDGSGMSTTVTPVTIDLSDAAIGGSATQEMFDDGSTGDDETADDGIYTYLMSGLNVATEDEGTYYLVITATDNVSNVNATANITLRVIADVDDPVIVSTTVEYPVGYESARPNELVVITAVVTDVLSGVQKVTVDATDLGLSVSENLTLTETADTWSGELTVGGEVSPDTYELTITATDYAANEATANVTVEVTLVLTGYNIDLADGWNLISLPLIPTDETIDVVLADISDNVSQVRTWVYVDGVLTEESWAEGGTVGDLTEMVDGQGYWIEMTEANTLTVQGSELPGPGESMPVYDVYEGWNLIGFKSVIPSAAEEYLGGAVTLIFERMYGYYTAGGFYTVIQTITDLEPGQGYWLAVSADGTIYP